MLNIAKFLTRFIFHILWRLYILWRDLWWRQREGKPWLVSVNLRLALNWYNFILRLTVWTGWCLWTFTLKQTKCILPISYCRLPTGTASFCLNVSIWISNTTSSWKIGICPWRQHNSVPYLLSNQNICKGTFLFQKSPMHEITSQW